MIRRDAHIHFIVSAEGYEPITTHVFSPDCPYLHTDPVFGVKIGLIADSRHIADPAEAKSLGLDGPLWSVEYDCVLAKSNSRS